MLCRPKKRRLCFDPGALPCAAGILADTSEDLQELARGTISTINEPANRAIVAGVAIVALSAAFKPHETFQYLGVLGLEFTLLFKLLQYESPTAAVRDWSEISSVAASKLFAVATDGSKKVVKAAQSAAKQPPKRLGGQPAPFPPKPVVTSQVSADMSLGGGGRDNGANGMKAVPASTNGVKTPSAGLAEPGAEAVGAGSAGKGKGETTPVEADKAR